MIRAVLPVVAVALFAAVVPTNDAAACGMYIPPEVEERVLLSDLLEEVDKAGEEEVAAPVVVEEAPKDGNPVSALLALLKGDRVEEATAATTPEPASVDVEEEPRS